MTNNVLNLIPTMQSISLVNHNLHSLKKKKPVKLAVDNIVGINLIKETTSFLG